MQMFVIIIILLLFCFQERKDYIKSVTGSEKNTLTADEMSVFYKKFLDENWNVHLQYNFKWYQKNIFLLILSFKVKLAKLKCSFMPKQV